MPSKLASLWITCGEQACGARQRKEVQPRLHDLATARSTGSVAEHPGLIRKHCVGKVAHASALRARRNVLRARCERATMFHERAASAPTLPRARCERASYIYVWNHEKALAADRSFLFKDAVP